MVWEQTTETSTWNETPLRTQPALINPDWKIQISRKRTNLSQILCPVGFFQCVLRNINISGNINFLLSLPLPPKAQGPVLIGHGFHTSGPGSQIWNQFFGWWYFCDKIQLNTWFYFVNKKCGDFYTAIWQKLHCTILYKPVKACRPYFHVSSFYKSHANHLQYRYLQLRIKWSYIWGVVCWDWLLLSGSCNVCLFRKRGRIPAERQDMVHIDTDPNRYSEMVALTHSQTNHDMYYSIYTLHIQECNYCTTHTHTGKIFCKWIKHTHRGSSSVLLVIQLGDRLRSFDVLADFFVTWWSKLSVSGPRTKWHHGHFPISFESHGHDLHNFWAYVSFDSTVIFKETKLLLTMINMHRIGFLFTTQYIYKQF